MSSPASAIGVESSPTSSHVPWFGVPHQLSGRSCSASASRWSLDDHPGLAGHDPAVIAAVLARDHARGRDDVTVLVARRERLR